MAEPGAVSVSNPLGDEKDEQDERSAAEGVPSPDFHRRLGPRLSTDEGRPTLLSLAAYASLSLVPLIFCSAPRRTTLSSTPSRSATCRRS